jgi:hypothetical protein
MTPIIVTNSSPSGLVSRVPVPSSVGGTAFFTDDFSSGNLTKTENNALWNGNTNASVVSCDGIGLTRSPSGAANAVQFRYAGPAGSFAELTLTLDSVGSGYSELFLRYYLFYPSGSEGGTVGPEFSTPSGPIGLKQLRVFDTPTNAGRTWAFGSESYYPYLTTPSRHRVLLYSGGPGFYNSPGPITNVNNGYDIPLGEWIKHEWHFKTNTVAGSGWNVGGDGILELYINNILKLQTLTGTLTPNDAKARGLYILGNNNAAFTNVNTRVYLADVAVSATGMV